MLAVFRPSSRLPPFRASAFPLQSRRQPTNRRYLLTGLGNEFFDLAQALPIPPELPVYSTTIILVTLVTRFALLPVSIWGKRKSRIIEEVVMPKIAEEKPVVVDQVFQQMKADKIRGEKPFLQEYHANKCREILTARRKELFKEYNCHPWKSMFFPPLVQLPPFIIFTMVLRRLSEDPTPFDAESFLTLSTLAHPDPTMTLPIVLGIITMANVETSNWLMTATQRTNLKRIEEKRAKMQAEGQGRTLEPGKIIKTALRGLSVVRILIASVVPGSITLYWVTSAAFGLFQTWVMDWMDYRRRKAIESSMPVGSAPAQVSPGPQGPKISKPIVSRTPKSRGKP